MMHAEVPSVNWSSDQGFNPSLYRLTKKSLYLLQNEALLAPKMVTKANSAKIELGQKAHN